MKIKIFFALLTLFFVKCVFAFTDADDEYPKSRLENEMDEMGSVLGGEGLMFRPSLVKNESTKKVVAGGVNKYLYDASLEILKFAPLASVDSNKQVIITEWYSPKGNSDSMFKINVFIKGETISPETLEVNVFERTKKQGKWSKDYKKSTISNVFEDKILRKARELYIQSSASE